MKQSIKSITKKATTIIKNGSSGIKAIQQGFENYNNYNQQIEDLANERVKNCVNCIHYKKEPNELLKVDDELIIEADEMMCNDCGCSLPYKLRQTIIKCDKWTK